MNATDDPCHRKDHLKESSAMVEIYRNNSSMVFLMVAIIPTTVKTDFKEIATYGANLKWYQGLQPHPLLSEISGVFGMLSGIV